MTLTKVPKGIKFIPPPTPFHVPEKRVVEHGQHMNATLVRTNPADENLSKCKKDIPFFKDGNPEECLQWMQNLDSVIVGLNIKTGHHREVYISNIRATTSQILSILWNSPTRNSNRPPFKYSVYIYH
jgi:hypothetical protein